MLGLLTLAALWQLAFVLGGSFVMPALPDTLARAAELFRSGDVWLPAGVTTLHVAFGFGLGGAIGLLLGLLAGSNASLGVMLETISTVILGVPPIIWIVLALLWFGPQGLVPTFTIAIGIAPVVFAGAFAGMRSARPEFDELAAAFNAPWHLRFFEIKLPQIMVPLLPALATALGFAWKIALMAEIIDSGSGIGGKIADARTHLDTVETMGWVLIAVGLLLASDFLLAQVARASAPGE